jgi:hypothetical protein
MIDPTTLIPIISGVISASVRIGVAIHTWWKNQRDQKTQHMAFEASRPTSQSASELHSLMDVQSSFWRTNPGMWQALGRETANVFQAYSKSNGYVGQLAQFAASAPERMDWNGASSGIQSVSSQLKDMFAVNLGKVISKMACRSFTRLFIPKETKDALAAENARLLKQAQTDLGLLAGQIAAGEDRTKKQLEWYQQQQQQLQQQPPPPQLPQPQPTQAGQYAQQPQYQQQGYQYSHPPPQYQHPAYQQWPQNTQQATYQQPQQQGSSTANTREESRSECVIA